MKVLLLQDISGVGRRGDVKEVKDGYGQNYLIPRGLAKFATKSVVEEATKNRRRKIVQHVKELQDVGHVFKQLDGKVVMIAGKANDHGHLFAQIHQGDIVKEVASQYGISIDSGNIIIDTPIKEIGAHTVRLAAFNSKATIVLDVKAIS